MFAKIISPLVGALLISLALISLSSDINPSLHLYMHQFLKQIQENIPIKYIREASLNRVKIIFSIYLLISGFVLHYCQGVKRLIVLIPLSIVSICMIKLTIIFSLSVSSIPIYIFLVVSIIIILFNDCAQLDELDI
ncbi:unnamed protein product [Rotaria sordida]|uniref:Uncharacterized protein n=1 Tax=Rotaria sordida TaxID=392033 RepID=A0A819MTY4_9BILA|nr:unnamed protein product [Rotaria sordida]CAF1422806.1 unnamed protein product [Rotaria sordida]CAF1592840.1 unnamed protein product [Rotaria sordida]CAF3984544.1 unnamed protein product [Rotaria sordida]